MIEVTKGKDKGRMFPRVMSRIELAAIDGSCAGCGRHEPLVWPQPDPDVCESCAEARAERLEEQRRE